ncbi:MAG TPA: hypothetical protein DEF12_07065 [Rhodobacteraceae bacterium]|jgi:hypothetical protein|nr:hypothetical protein [Paracoccaceae bacterium]HBV54784.1 hypothetical protein [Paracoccaceae bacterium]
MTTPATLPAFTLQVFRSGDLLATHGANMGDGLSFAAELVPDDTYELRPHSTLRRLALRADTGATFRIAPSTLTGLPGALIHLDSCLTLMSPDGQTTEVITLVEVDGAGDVAEIYALPLAPLVPRTTYSLVGIDRESARSRLAAIACVSFTAGTQITMASGAQRAIETLAIGDRVLTRDDGPQPLRWIGRTTTRAVGEMAPILITKGALNNSADLLVSPEHRLFIYQRSDALGAGRAEVLVRARHLVNETTVLRREGGFIDYFQLLFDSHQIIYAEGIAAETMLVDTRTRAALPPELAEKLAQSLPGHTNRPHLQFEVPDDLLNRPDAAELLRRASTR